MAALHSFYLAPEAWSLPFRLGGSEARHLSRVLRVKPGATVRLFDGYGREGMFVVDVISKNTVNLTLRNERITSRPPARSTLAAGFSKALRRGWFMEKAVELEASALWFWQGERSQAELPELEKNSWRSSLIAGAKQCGNAWLPELAMLRGGASALVARRSSFERAFLFYEGDTEDRLLRQEDLTGAGDILLVVGPEGGFSPQEFSLLKGADFIPVSLGKRVLRWETAAILTLGLAWWARQRP
ncbi:MAG: 16S rRNA (uracil(1498)-N(3))-methyltransferase [Desulfovibrio sp.]|jgi:16S rRNA (uracil1498-N3)-methyltransferase|nr:16S rRNA (uracil(1498)-N(3))-methyltransferase [Desulfovibrio sp.]